MGRQQVTLALIALAAITAGCDDSDVAPSADPPATAHSGSSLTAEPPTSPAADASAAPGADAGKKPPEPDCSELVRPWNGHAKWPGTREEQNQLLLKQLACVHRLDDEQQKRLRDLFDGSEYIGQGNPAVAKHPVTVDQCLEALRGRGEDFRVPEFERICGSKYMAPLYDPETQQPADAAACIDRFEFPNIPCTYPVTWVRANEAVRICQAMGKRLCDAHEWEGACFGSVGPPDYPFDAVKNMKHKAAVKHMRGLQNSRIEKSKRWAYGDQYRKGVCGTSSRKSKDCGVGWRKCGTNTFPSGYFPYCKSPLGVYDQHGNAAEHMNLPLAPKHLSTAPDSTYGVTEMKGSWFVFDQIKAHKDHCRWRAPFWHGTRVLNPNSHRNYHLGFRCCKSIK